MYTKPATGDFKTDQTSFAPAEYAADKHAVGLPSSSLPSRKANAELNLKQAESTPLASKSRETSPVEVAPLPITSTLPEPIPHIEHPAFKSDKGTTHGEPKPFKAPEPVVPAASVAAPAPPAGAPPPTPKPIDVPAPVDAAAVTDTTTPHQHHQQSTEEPSSALCAQWGMKSQR